MGADNQSRQVLASRRVEIQIGKLQDSPISPRPVNSPTLVNSEACGPLFIEVPLPEQVVTGTFSLECSRTYANNQMRYPTFRTRMQESVKSLRRASIEWIETVPVPGFSSVRLAINIRLQPLGVGPRQSEFSKRKAKRLF